MFDFIKNIIEKGNFELKDIIYKINKMYIENHLTEEQKQELEGLARERANPENSYAEANEQYKAIWDALKEDKQNIKKLQDELKEVKKEIEKMNGQDVPEEDITEEPEVYPEYKQPLGSHDAYNIGDKITYNGIKYECLIDNCVWTPITYPDAWQEIVE